MSFPVKYGNSRVALDHSLHTLRILNFTAWHPHVIGLASVHRKHTFHDIILATGEESSD